MPITVTPHTEIKCVLVYTFTDPWTWHELMFAFEEERQYSTTLNPNETYITLVLMHEAKSMAPGLSLSHFQYMQKHNPTNWDCVIVVRNPNNFFNPLFTAASNFPAWRDSVLLVDTVEEAHETIQKRRIAP